MDASAPRRMIKLLDLTLDSPAENLALDEALLESAEQEGWSYGVLRLWESPQPAVVIGRSSSVSTEVDEHVCQARGLPIVRRSSGGAAVLIGPGCLMYSLVLGYAADARLRVVEQAHQVVLETLVAALSSQLSNVCRQGISDLTWGGRKFSGNSLRCKREHLLYHGTLLYDYPLGLIGDTLRTPPRQPEYRENRSHLDFVTNLPLSQDALRTSLTEQWRAHTRLEHWPREAVFHLSQKRYSKREWNFRRP